MYNYIQIICTIVRSISNIKFGSLSFVLSYLSLSLYLQLSVLSLLSGFASIAVAFAAVAAAVCGFYLIYFTVMFWLSACQASSSSKSGNSYPCVCVCVCIFQILLQRCTQTMRQHRLHLTFSGCVQAWATDTQSNTLTHTYIHTLTQKCHNCGPSHNSCSTLQYRI